MQKKFCYCKRDLSVCLRRLSVCKPTKQEVSQYGNWVSIVDVGVGVGGVPTITSAIMFVNLLTSEISVTWIFGVTDLSVTQSA